MITPRTSSHPPTRVKRRRDREEPVFLQVTMLLVKLMLGTMAVVLAGVALMNYRILLHHDGQVEFVRKSEWTIADSFRFIGEEAAPEPVVARKVPLEPSRVELPAPVVAAIVPPVAPPAAPPSIAAIPSPKPAVVAPRPVVVAARPRPPVKPVPVEEDEEPGDDPIRAVLSTVRPTAPRAAAPVAAPVTDPSLADCRRIRRAMASGVGRMEAARGGVRTVELRVFELIQGGYLDQLESCPSLGGFILQRRGSAPEIRCTVHGVL